MAITTVDGFIAAPKQQIRLIKTASLSPTSISLWSDPFAVNGQPGAGVLAGTSTTTGVVPTDATAGFPSIVAFGGGATGYITQISAESFNPGRIGLFDVLWKGGAYAFNANTTGNTPTSYAGRVPNSEWGQCEIWYEQVTTGTGVQTVTVHYLDENGTASQTADTIVGTGLAVGRLHNIALATGDKGVQGITGVVATSATVGTFNLLVVRRLWVGRVRVNNDMNNYSMDLNGMPVVYDTSALAMFVAMDSTSMPANTAISLTIANG